MYLSLDQTGEDNESVNIDKNKNDERYDNIVQIQINNLQRHLLG